MIGLLRGFFSLNYRSIEQFKGKIKLILTLKILESFLEVIGISMILPLLNLFFNDEKFSRYKDILSSFNLTFNKNEIFLFFLFLILIVSIIKFSVLFYNNKIQHIFFNEYRISLIKKIINNFFNKDEIKEFENERRNVINLTLNESEKASWFFKFYWQIISVSLVTLGITIFLLIVSFKVTVIVITVYFVFLLIFKDSIRNFSIKSGNKRVILNKSISSQINKILELCKVIRLENIFKNFKKEIDKELDEFSLNLSKFGAYSNLWKYLTEPIVIAFFLSTISFVVLIFKIDLKESIPLIAIFIFCINRVSQQISNILNSYMQLNLYKNSVINIENFLNQKDPNIFHLKKIFQDSKKKFNENEINELEIQSISQSFNDKIIINNLNFVIKSEKINFILGNSGSGKSTLLDIIAGLKEPESGKVLINNYSLYKDCNLISFRDRVSYIYQNCPLFEKPLIDNLTLSQNYFNIEDSKKYSDLVKILNLEFLFSNKNINSFSGGEKQRALILRACLKKSKIVIFDESFSGIDNKTAKSFLDYIRLNNLNKTFIVTTHNHEILNEQTDNIIKI